MTAARQSPQAAKFGQIAQWNQNHAFDSGGMAGGTARPPAGGTFQRWAKARLQADIPSVHEGFARLPAMRTAAPGWP